MSGLTGNHNPRPPRPITKQHRDVVAALAAVGWQTHNFRAAVRDATTIDLPGRAWLVPDAFRIEPDRRLVAVCEVIVSHDISKRAEDRYRKLFRWLDELGWVLRIFVSDRRGKACELDAATCDLSPESQAQAVAVLDRRP